MLLGKRHRPPIKRTTSLSEITFDLNGELEPSDQQNGNDLLDQRFMAMVSPRVNHRRHSSDYAETGHFLRLCSLCKNRLVPGQDIYMYRGDAAFCSLECRQQQMTKDEWKQKCGLASKKEASNSSAPTVVVAAGGSSNGETVTAV